MNSIQRYSLSSLIDFTAALFKAAGCDGDKPQTIAQILVEADLLGHTTHGLQLAPGYLRELQSSSMTATGEPEIVADRGGTATWDGRRLPGVWLTAKAVDLAIKRAAKHGIAAVSIRNSHHIGCLAAYLERATKRGMMLIVASSDPAAASVAPFGGSKPVFTPDPIAVGIPTEGEPILIDISASITTNGLANRLKADGGGFPGQWAIDANGQATNDPNALFTNPPGTLLPTGGLDHGHKGYALALMIEALTQGLSGFGRADAPKGWGASVFVQAIDPAAFGGASEFQRQTSWTADACRANPPLPGRDAVRLPGQRGLEHRRLAMTEGLSLYPGILDALRPFAEKFGVEIPNTVG